MSKHLKNELKDVISGKSQVRFGAIIQSITNYLKTGKGPSSKVKNTQQSREKETKRLKKFISLNDWEK